MKFRGHENRGGAKELYFALFPVGHSGQEQVDERHRGVERRVPQLPMVLHLNTNFNFNPMSNGIESKS